MNGELSGTVKLVRSLALNSLWTVDGQKFCFRAAWIDLLLLANDKDTVFQPAHHPSISIKRGQVCWSQLRLAQRWSWARDTVDAWLKQLQSQGRITYRPGKLVTLITITNYDLFNPPETASGSASDQASETASGSVADSATEVSTESARNRKGNRNTPLGTSISQRPATATELICFDHELRRLEADQATLDAELGALYAAGDTLPPAKRERLRGIEEKIAALRERVMGGLA